MKKTILNFIAITIITMSLTSCATVFGGKVSDCQRTKPVAGEPSRKVRAGALIANIVLFWPGLIVDFATGAIYKPCEKK
jgi:predicted small secreted protein